MFFRVGLFTFGGGYAMISILEDACVKRRAWISAEDMDNLVVLAESTPGPVAINCATFVGKRQGGLAGALCATLGVVLPSFLVILLVSRFLDRLLTLPLADHAFRGIRAAVVILVLDAGRKLFRRLPRRPLPILLFGGAFAAMLLLELFSLKLSSVWLLILAGTVSVLVHGISGAGKGGDNP